MKYIINLIIILFSFCTAYPQVNTDSLFQSSIDNARDENYDKSIAEARVVLKILPERADVMVHIANVYSWQSKFDSSKIYISKAFMISPFNNELYDSWLNMLLWNEEFAELLRVANIAESNNYENKGNLALKKFIALKETGNYKEGIEYAKTLDNEIINVRGFKEIYNEVYNLTRQNILTAFYSLDFYKKNSPSPQSYAFIDNSFKIRKHTLIPRLSYSKRFEKEDFLLESDYYHLLKNKRYLFISYGIGLKKEVFSNHRAGFEYFFPVIKFFEGSAGCRYMRYDTSNIYILNGHLEKYIHNSWLSIRPYFVFKGDGNAVALVANYRLYLRNPANFWGIEVSYGNSPDDRYVISGMEGIFRLNAYRIRAERNILLNLKNEVKLSLGYSDEEYTDDEFRSRYAAEIFLRHRF